MQNAASPEKTGKKSGVPASGSDLLPEPCSESAEASLLSLRKDIASCGADCAAAFLGYADPAVSIPCNIELNGILEQCPTAQAYPFLMYLTPADCAAKTLSELYCIVPAEGVCSVVAEETETEDGEPTDRVKETLYWSETAEPFFLCGESNGWGEGSVRVTLQFSNGREVHFRPCLYSNLGTIARPDTVLDFTVYDNVTPLYSGAAD